MKLTRKGQFIMHDLLPLGGIFRLLLLFKQNKNERIKIEGFLLDAKCLHRRYHNKKSIGSL